MSTSPHSRPRLLPLGAGDRPGLIRVGLHLLLAALPLLAISAHVFGLVRMQLSAAILVIPLATAMVALAVFAPHGGDRVLAHGMVWGIVACAVYDVFRLDTVYMLGWWADFIPTMGTWITGDPDDLVGGAVVGYLWRYVGDGGGIGITFFALASAVGLQRHSRRTVVLTCVAFAVCPVWAGLIGTVALATDGQTMMFPLTPTTVTLSLIGHLIFGWILGLGFWRSRAVQQHWPWEPVTGEQPTLRTRLTTALAPAPPASGPMRAAYPSGPMPAAHPSGPMPAAHPSGAMPAAHPSGAMPAVHPSGPMPAAYPSGPMPAAAVSGPVAIPRPSGPPPVSGPLPTLASTRPPHPATATVAGAGAPDPAPTGGPSGTAGGVSSEPVPAHRDPGPPPAGQTIDPETWELWQRQLQTSVRGRRTHGAPRSVRSRAR